MKQIYDVTLKNLIKALPPHFLRLLTGFDTCVFLDVQFPDIQYRQPDLLMLLPNGKLFHLELQATNDADMHLRMALYLLYIYAKYGLEVKQVVLYVGKDAITMRDTFSVGGMQYEYHLLDIRDVDGQYLLESGNVEDAIIALLCKSPNIYETAHNIVNRLSVLPEMAAKDSVLKLLNISRLRNIYERIKEEVRKMPVIINAETDELYLAGLREGKLKGLREGELKGLREGELKGLRDGELKGLREGELKGLREGELKGLRDGLVTGITMAMEFKFGDVSTDMIEIIRNMDSIERLNDLREKIRAAATVDELKVLLGVL